MKKTAVLMIICLLFLLFSSCAINTSDSVPHVRWLSEEPYFLLDYDSELGGALAGELILYETSMNVFINFDTSRGFVVRDSCIISDGKIVYNDSTKVYIYGQFKCTGSFERRNEKLYLYLDKKCRELAGCKEIVLKRQYFEIGDSTDSV